jgi:hypothetical protein
MAGTILKCMQSLSRCLRTVRAKYGRATSLILRSPLPSHGALRPQVDCRSIACFPTAGLWPFVNIISTAGLKIVPLQSVYAGTKNAVRTISEGLRQEAGDRVRYFAGFVRTGLAESHDKPGLLDGAPYRVRWGADLTRSLASLTYYLIRATSRSICSPRAARIRAPWRLTSATTATCSTRPVAAMSRLACFSSLASPSVSSPRPM